jgi:RNA polymerase sigma-70 factor (ECF subfamily)
MFGAHAQRKTAPPAEEGSRPLELAEVYRRHAQTVWRWAHRLGGPSVDAEDIVQEVFVAVHRQLPGFRGDSALTTWLYGITSNVVKDRRRKGRITSWARGSAEDVAGHLVSMAPPSDEELHRKQQRARVYQLLDQMKERYRNVLILHELEGLSGEDIAQLTGAKVNTVYVWLHRARADFAKRLGALEAAEDGR